MIFTENDETISILGYRNTKISDANDFLKKIKTKVAPAAVQLIDADQIAGATHLLFAFLNAQKAFSQKRALCKSLDMETMLYASGQSQINRAIEALGIKPRPSSIAAIIISRSQEEARREEEELTKLVPGTRDDSVLEVKGANKVKKLRTTFDITDLELETMEKQGEPIEETLTWLIVENTALLAAKR